LGMESSCQMDSIGKFCRISRIGNSIDCFNLYVFLVSKGFEREKKNRWIEIFVMVLLKVF
jgi:hypothetical protein